MSQEQNQLLDIVDRYSLEGTRIQVGRERIYPLREGLDPSEQALEKLQAALRGKSITGSVKITRESDLIYQISKGAVKQPMSPELQQVSDQLQQTLETEPAAVEADQLTLEALGAIEDKPELRAGEVISSLQDRQAKIGEEPVAPLEVNALEARKVLVNDPNGVVGTNTTATSYEDMRWDNLPQPVPGPQIPEPTNDDGVPQASESEPLEGRDLYMQMIGRSPIVYGQSFDDIVETAQDTPRLGEYYDLAVMEEAHKADITPEAVTRAIAHGPNIRAMESKGASASEINLYLAEKQTNYRFGNFDAAEYLQAPDPHRYPTEARNVMSQTVQTSRNLKTFADCVKSPVLKQWGQKLQDLHRQAVPIAHIAAKALGQLAENLAIVPPANLDKAARELVSMFGKNGQYRGDTFNYDVQGENALILLKDGTPIFKDGKYNYDCNPAQLSKLKGVPDQVRAAKAEVKAQVSQKQTSRTVEAIA
jgi:hypothetical protein